jgi:hypothetical protein
LWNYDDPLRPFCINAAFFRSLAKLARRQALFSIVLPLPSTVPAMKSELSSVVHVRIAFGMRREPNVTVTWVDMAFGIPKTTSKYLP